MNAALTAYLPALAVRLKAQAKTVITVLATVKELPNAASDNQQPKVPPSQSIRSSSRNACWQPHKLRHNAATELRKQFSIEAARVVLGHTSAVVTEIYAEMDFAKAQQIMADAG